jgi:hypothetical protein
MRGEQPLDLGGRDVHPTTNDQILCPVDITQEPAVESVHLEHLARAEVAVFA